MTSSLPGQWVVEEVPPEEGMDRIREPVFAEAMPDAQEETLGRELSGRGLGTASRPIVS